MFCQLTKLQQISRKECNNYIKMHISFHKSNLVV